MRQVYIKNENIDNTWIFHLDSQYLPIMINPGDQLHFAFFAGDGCETHVEQGQMTVKFRPSIENFDNTGVNGVNDLRYR